MFYHGFMHRLISLIVLSLGFISVFCVFVCVSFFLYLVYDSIINNKNIVLLYS